MCSLVQSLSRCRTAKRLLLRVIWMSCGNSCDYSTGFLKSKRGFIVSGVIIVSGVVSGAVLTIDNAGKVCCASGKDAKTIAHTISRSHLPPHESRRPARTDLSRRSGSPLLPRHLRRSLRHDSVGTCCTRSHFNPRDVAMVWRRPLGTRASRHLPEHPFGHARAPRFDQGRRGNRPYRDRVGTGCTRSLINPCGVQVTRRGHWQCETPQHLPFVAVWSCGRRGV